MFLDGTLIAFHLYKVNKNSNKNTYIKMNKHGKIVVAMSGGIDSCIAARCCMKKDIK